MTDYAIMWVGGAVFMLLTWRFVEWARTQKRR